MVLGTEYFVRGGNGDDFLSPCSSLVRPTASVSIATLLVLQIVYPLNDCLACPVVLQFENK